MTPDTLLLKGTFAGYFEGNDVYELDGKCYVLDDGLAGLVPRADVEPEDVHDLPEDYYCPIDADPRQVLHF
jgi:hypothetical protein